MVVGRTVALLLLLVVFVCSSQAISYSEGQAGLDGLDALIRQQIRPQSGYDELKSAYGGFASNHRTVQFSTLLSDFGAELSGLTTNYLNGLSFLSAQLGSRYDATTSTGAVANLSWPASFPNLTDVTNVTGPLLMAADAAELLDTDVLDAATRSAFLNGDAQLALLDAWTRFWDDTDENDVGTLVGSLGVGQLGLTSVFFGSESFTLSRFLGGVVAPVFHPANASWSPFKPQFRPWYVSTATLQKLVIVALVYPVGADAMWRDNILPAGISLLTMLGASDYVTVIIDYRDERYFPLCANGQPPSLTRAKPEVVQQLVDWLLDWQPGCDGCANTSSRSTFNVSFAMHSQFAGSCPSKSSQITIVYVDSTPSQVLVPSGSAVKRLWDSSPINNRVVVLYFVRGNERAVEQRNHLALINLACQNSGVYVPVRVDRDAVDARLYDVVQFLNAQLQPYQPTITVGVGWHDTEQLLSWTVTLPVYSDIQPDDSAGDKSNSNANANAVPTRTLLGVVGFDVQISVFANVLFRARRFDSYCFVTSLDLDVLLHIGMQSFNFVEQTSNISSLHAGLPYSKSIAAYETANSQLQLTRYASPADIADLELAMSGNDRSRVYYADAGRGYAWSKFQFFDLLLVITYVLPGATFTPQARDETFLPVDRAGTTCANAAALTDSYQYAVPIWSPSLLPAQVAQTRAVPDGQPLQIHQYRGVTQANASGLPQRTWNISAAQYLVGAYQSADQTGAQLPLLAVLSAAMIEGQESLLLGLDVFADSRRLFDAVNALLSCTSLDAAGLLPDALAATQITAGLPRLWSDVWTATLAAGQPPLPFLYAAVTPSLYRFWPANDAVSLSSSGYVDLDMSLLPDGAASVRTYYVDTRSAGAAATEFVYALRADGGAAVPAAGLAVPPSAYTSVLVEYAALRPYVLDQLLPFCLDAATTRCYVVDSALSVVLASADIQWNACRFQFAGQRNALAAIEPTLVAAMRALGLVRDDATALNGLRVARDNVTAAASPFVFGAAGCPSGVGYAWKTAANGQLYLLAVDDANIAADDLCSAQFAQCSANTSSNSNSSSSGTDLICAYVPSGPLLRCPSSDVSQQVIESLRPSQLKCFDPDSPDVQLLTFTDIVSIVLYGTYAVFAIVVLLLFGLFFKHRHSSVIESSNPIFVFATLTGTLLACVSVFFWIGVPNDATCIARMWFAVCCFALLTGMVFAKILYVYLNIKDPKVLRIKMPDRLLIAYAMMPIVPQVIIVIIWTAYDPLTAKLVLDPINYGTLEQQTAQWVCSSDTSLPFYLTIYTIQGILLAAGAVLTLTTRKTKSLWNESTWIGLCVYVSAIVYPTVILLRELLDATPDQEFLILFIGVFIGVAAFIAFVFCTKAYVILFSPELNSTEARVAAEIDTNFQPADD